MIPFKKILIVGLGLMGGSMSRDLMRLRDPEKGPKLFDGEVDGIVRSPRSRDTAVSLGMADNVYTAAGFHNDFSRYDLIVLSIPVHHSIEFLDTLPVLDSTLVIDMGSTKRQLMKHYLKCRYFDRFVFIPCHPMCGSELAGPSAAVEHLYRDKLCFVLELDWDGPEQIDVPADFRQKSGASARRVVELWKALGSVVFGASPVEHDEALAYLSHSPHLLASLIVHWAAGNQSVNRLTELSPMGITGGGFKDMVRIAGSNPQMWEEIIVTNRENIVLSLKEFRGELDNLIGMIETGEAAHWNRFISEAYALKKFLTGQE